MRTLADKWIAQGREEGLKTGREEGLKKGREEGLKKSREEGLTLGENRGRAAGLRVALRTVAEQRFGPLSRGELARLEAADFEALERGVARVLAAHSFDVVLPA